MRQIFDPTWMGYLCVLVVLLFSASNTRAQQPTTSPPEETQSASPSPTVPAAQQPTPAQSSLQKEEHPRVFWIIPTHSVSNLKSAAPLSSREKFGLFVRISTDPFTIATNSIQAGVEQANDDLSGYGQGVAGYAKRFGAGMAY